MTLPFKTKKIPGIVLTEAYRITRNMVKEQIKREGKRITDFTASEITARARLLITPEILGQAKRNIVERAQLVDALDKTDLKKVPISKAIRVPPRHG